MPTTYTLRALVFAGIMLVLFFAANVYEHQFTAYFSVDPKYLYAAVSILGGVIFLALRKFSPVAEPAAPITMPIWMRLLTGAVLCAGAAYFLLREELSEATSISLRTLDAASAAVFVGFILLMARSGLSRDA